MQVRLHVAGIEQRFKRAAAGAADRLLKSATEWTKCVFGSSAEAVEAENLFFSLGGPTPPMST